MDAIKVPQPTRFPAGPYPFNGDVRCIGCGEYVNKRCWLCGRPRDGAKRT